MFFIYSYKGYTITQNIMLGTCYITYPDNQTGNSDITTNSLDKAYKFVDEMEDNK